MTSQTQSQDWLYRNPVPGKQHRYNTDITEHSLQGKNGQKSALLSLEIMNVICIASFVCNGKRTLTKCEVVVVSSPTPEALSFLVTSTVSCIESSILHKAHNLQS